MKKYKWYESVKNAMSLNNFEDLRYKFYFDGNEKEMCRGEPGHDKLYKNPPSDWFPS